MSILNFHFQIPLKVQITIINLQAQLIMAIFALLTLFYKYLDHLTLALASQPSFVEYIFQLAKIVNNYESVNQQVCVELAKIMKLLQCDIEVIEVSRLTDLLEQDQSYNYFRQQQDCLELFNLLIRHIEKAQQEILQFDLSSIRRKEVNLINPFLHYTKMRIICRTCNKAFQSTKLESHYNIHLQIQQANSINEAMQLLIEPEMIDDYICLYCTLDRMQQVFQQDSQIIEQYKYKSYFDNDAQEIIKQCLVEIKQNIDPKILYQRRQVYKYIAIAKYPSIICFHLNRVVFYHDQLYKIDKQISLDSKINIADHSFGLSSVICHIGNSNFGHYVTIKRTFAPELLNHLEEKQKYYHQEWYLTSDKYVVNCEEPNQSEAYLVFYDSL